MANFPQGGPCFQLNSELDMYLVSRLQHLPSLRCLEIGEVIFDSKKVLKVNTFLGSLEVEDGFVSNQRRSKHVPSKDLTHFFFFPPHLFPRLSVALTVLLGSLQAHDWHEGPHIFF